MRKPPVLFCALLLLIVHPAAVKGQRDSSFRATEKFRVCSFGLQNGISLQNGNSLESGEYLALAPQSKLLKPGSTYSPDENSSWSSGFTTNMILGFKFSNKKKSQLKERLELQIGVSFVGAQYLNNNFFKYDYKTYDTITSIYANDTTFIDSVTYYRIAPKYSYLQIHLSTALVFRSDQAERLSGYGGIGFAAGISLNPQTYVYSSSSSYTSERYKSTQYGYTSNYNTGYYSKIKSSTETFHNKGGFAGAIYLPIGLDFRIGSWENYLNGMHFFFELRPSFDFTTIPELHKTVWNSSALNSFGLRYSF